MVQFSSTHESATSDRDIPVFLILQTEVVWRERTAFGVSSVHVRCNSGNIALTQSNSNRCLSVQLTTLIESLLRMAEEVLVRQVVRLVHHSPNLGWKVGLRLCGLLRALCRTVSLWTYNYNEDRFNSFKTLARMINSWQSVEMLRH